VRSPKTGFLLAAALIAALLSVALSACGGGGSSSSTASAAGSGSGSQTGASGTLSSSVVKAEKKVEGLLNGENYEQPPATSPPPKSGLKVTLVDIGLALPAGQEFAEYAEAAAKTLGWSLSVYDAQLNPSQYQDGIRQAIANGSEAIMLYSVNCSEAQQALEEAKKAAITVVTAESVDCNESTPPGPKLFSGEVIYTVGNWRAFTEKVGEAQATYAIAETEGKAKVLLLEQSGLLTATYIKDGFVTELERCQECEVVDGLKFTFADLGPKLQEKVQQALLQNPEANVLAAPYDELMTSGVAPAVVEAGRAQNLISIAGVGFEANIELVREGQGQTAGYIVAVGWEAYASADTLNRVVRGQKPQVSGIGVGFFDKEHNLPATGNATAPIDFVAAYEKAWSSAK
jgi:ribose transport system substrate-binding protein